MARVTLTSTGMVAHPVTRPSENTMYRIMHEYDRTGRRKKWQGCQM